MSSLSYFQVLMLPPNILLYFCSFFILKKKRLQFPQKQSAIHLCCALNLQMSYEDSYIEDLTVSSGAFRKGLDCAESQLLAVKSTDDS